jgi:hypothetical protein
MKTAITLILLIFIGLSLEAQTADFHQVRIVPSAPGTPGGNAIGEIDMQARTSTNYVGIAPPDTVPLSTLWRWPKAEGAPGSAIITDGAGNLSFGVPGLSGGDITGLSFLSQYWYESQADVPATGTVTTSGANVTWVSGALFSRAMVGLNMTLPGPVNIAITAVVSPTALVLASSAGALTNVAYNVSGGDAFRTSQGTMRITGAGDIQSQSLAVTNGIVTGVSTAFPNGHYGLTGAGVLTVASCSGCGAGGGGGGSSGGGGSVQFSNGTGGFLSNTNFIFETTTGDVSAVGFNCVATGPTPCMLQTNGTFSITGAGDFAGQSVAVKNGITTGAGAFGLTGAGALTISSCSGCPGGSASSGGGGLVQYSNGSGGFSSNAGFVFSTTTGDVSANGFNCVSTGATPCILQSGGTFSISGAGNFAGQSVALQNGITTGAGAFGLSGTGALTISSCSGCPGGSASSGGGGLVQYSNGSGGFSSNAGFVFSTTTGDVSANGFNCVATGATPCMLQSGGTFSISGGGAFAGQTMALQGGITTGAGAFGLSGTGVLTIASCSGCPSGAGPSGALGLVQYSNGNGTFGSNANVTINGATGAVSGTSFDCVATGATACVLQQSGTFSISGAGAFAGQSVALQAGITTGAGAFGLSGTGALTIASCSGCPGIASGASGLIQLSNGAGGLTSNAVLTFNTGTGAVSSTTFDCVATGAAGCIIQQSGTFSITGAGNAAFQSVALQNGITTGAGAFGLTGAGALTVSSCSGCPSNPSSGLNGYIQYSNGNGTFGSNSVLTFNGGTGAVSATTFDCVATGATNCIVQQSGTFSISGAGNAAFQSEALQNGITTGNGAYGLSGTGALRIASCSGCPITLSSGGSGAVQFSNGASGFTSNGNFTFNTGTSDVSANGFVCVATGGVGCVFQTSGTFSITGAGAAAFQSLAVGTGSPFNIDTSGNIVTSANIQNGASANAFITVGANGNFYNRVMVAPSTALSCSGVATGWTAISYEQPGAPYLVVCQVNTSTQVATRYRVQMTAY